MWFLFALATTLLWGAADLFYKLGADERDPYSHLKTSMAVGLVMGIHAAATLLFSGIRYDWHNILIYLPVSAMYILSMTIGYLGLRYLELSVASPVQNTSGALVSILCLVILGQSMDALSAAAVALICLGVFALGLLESRAEKRSAPDIDRKYSVGLRAFMLPVLYCVFDALGTFFDAYYLDDYASTPLVGVTEESFETVANLSYELTFLLCAVLIFIFLRVRGISVRLPEQKTRLGAAVFETAGQFAYVYAMSGRGIVAAPMVASYCIVSVVLSRIFLKERLSRAQYAVVAAVVLGIAMLGLAEGLAE